MGIQEGQDMTKTDDLLPVHPNPYLYHFPKVLFSLHMRLSLSLGQSLIISPKPTDT